MTSNVFRSLVFGLLVLTILFSISAKAAPRMATSSRISQKAPLEFSLDRQSYDQECSASTWCPRGYQIWCYASGYSCSSDEGYGSWVWCASYDEYGYSWESSDYCY